MAKKKDKIQFDIELCYVSEYFRGGDYGASNGCNCDDTKEFNRAKRDHTDDNAKKVLNSTLRANFNVEIKTNKLTLGEINKKVEEIANNEEIKKLVELSRKYQEYILSVSKVGFPDLDRKNDMVICEDWISALTVEKNKLGYRTNIYNHISKQPEVEVVILDILQEFVDHKLDKYVNVNMHYNCWAYLLNKDKYSHEFKLQELINHRKYQLTL